MLTRSSPRCGKNLRFSFNEGYMYSRSSDGGCRAAQSQVYQYTQRATLYVLVYLRCRDDVAFELGSGITWQDCAAPPASMEQMKSQLPETGRSCSAASPGSWHGCCGLHAAPTLIIPVPRPPNRPVHATPSARSRPAMSKHRRPSRGNHVFPRTRLASSSILTQDLAPGQPRTSGCSLLRTYH